MNIEEEDEGEEEEERNSCRRLITRRKARAAKTTHFDYKRAESQKRIAEAKKGKGRLLQVGTANLRFCVLPINSSQEKFFLMRQSGLVL